jgi:hypothetical protein
VQALLHRPIGPQASIDPPWQRNEENTDANEQRQHEREQCRNKQKPRRHLAIQERMKYSGTGLAAIFHDYLA